LHEGRHVSRVDHPGRREDPGYGEVHHAAVMPALDDIKGVRREEGEVLIDGSAQRTQVVQEGYKGMAAWLHDSEQLVRDGPPIGLLEKMVHGSKTEDSVEAVAGEPR